MSSFPIQRIVTVNVVQFSCKMIEGIENKNEFQRLSFKGETYRRNGFSPEMTSQ